MPIGGSKFIYKMSFGRLFGDLDIYSVHSFFATLGVESDPVAFANVVDQTGDVYKNFLLGGVFNDEAKAFGFVEELYGSIKHKKN